MEGKHCKWYNDEFCTNGDSPCVADYCPVVEYPELCKHREVDKDINVRSKTEEKVLTDEEIKQAFFILRHGSSEGLSEYIKAVLAIESKYDRQKAEIERLTEEIKEDKVWYSELYQTKTELQKQVDELTKKLEKYKANKAWAVTKEVSEEIKQQTEKATAKEILQELYSQIDEKTPKWVGVQIKIIAKRKGVEVE